MDHYNPPASGGMSLGPILTCQRLFKIAIRIELGSISLATLIAELLESFLYSLHCLPLNRSMKEYTTAVMQTAWTRHHWPDKPKFSLVKNPFSKVVWLRSTLNCPIAKLTLFFVFSVSKCLSDEQSGDDEDDDAGRRRRSHNAWKDLLLLHDGVGYR